MKIDSSNKFDKKFLKLPVKIRVQFSERLTMFIANPQDPLLKNHSLHGKMSGRKSFAINGDYRVIYRLISHEVIEFINIGTHNQVY